MKKIIRRSLSIVGLTVFSASAYAADCSNLSAWTAQDTYNTGDQVQAGGNAYKANWWTQNQAPATNSGPNGSGQPWTDEGSCTGGGGNTNVAPSANANGPYAANLGNAVSFSSAGSQDSDGTIASYAWNFGDGNSSSTASPSHTYASTGTFNVVLTVTDNDGATASSNADAVISDSGSGGGGNCGGLPAYSAGTAYSAGQHVANGGVEYNCTVAGWCSSSAAWAYEPGVGAHWQSAWAQVGACGGGNTNVPPTANANGAYSASLGSAIAFTSAGSNDSDGSIASFSWDFGDGNTVAIANPSHTYGSAGTYNVALTVTDNDGASASSSTTATISGDSNANPVAEANGPYSASIGNAISFSSGGSQDSDGTVASYAWDFGDGNSSTQQNPSHTYASIGNYNAVLTVTDNDGATATDSATASVTNGTPPPSGDKKVVGYFAQWGVYARNYHIKNLVTSGSAEKLTHIVYAFGNVQNGQCVVGDAYADYDKFYDANASVDGTSDSWDAGALRGSFNQIKKLKAMYPNIKVVWSFGGWTWSGGFGQASQNAAAFADSCYNLVNDPRWTGVFDGIDIDWEYPNSCGLSCDSSGRDAYPRLMQALRARFGNQLVTSAIGAGSAKLNAADYGEAAQYLDFYMLMTYDFFGAWAATGPTAPHSALDSFPSIPADNSDFYSSNAVNILKGFGVPSDKILLGIGFYGRGWTGVTQSAPGGSATAAATGSYEAGIEDYKVLKNTCPATGTVAGTAYAHCGNNWWSYDTPATIQGKMNYLNQQGLGGAFFWEFSGDTRNGELINAIRSGL